MSKFKKIVTPQWVRKQSELMESPTAFRDAFHIDPGSWTSWVNLWISPTTGKMRSISGVAASGLYFAVKLWKRSKGRGIKVPKYSEDAKAMLFSAIEAGEISIAGMAEKTGIHRDYIASWRTRKMSSYARMLAYAYLELERMDKAKADKEAEESSDETA